ncbi:hypothetical protein ET475_07020 [Microbacterium protaetiae]|uniref:Lactonase family protein n=1 Tax=Microbacterium protaetiae TaxID=2509458 RepID=A0A4P6ECI2_9MICO|nr:hypothetical protein ET475_07020 [Microbacterium protaetiae]
MRFLTGGYTADMHGSATGIGVLVAGAADDALAGGPLAFTGDAAATGGSPSWIAAHPTRDVVYAALEANGAVQAFARTGEASFVRLGEPVAAGELTCHVAVAPDGGSLIAACWGDGRVVRMSLDAAGRPSSPVIAPPAADPYAEPDLRSLGAGGWGRWVSGRWVRWGSAMCVRWVVGRTRARMPRPSAFRAPTRRRSYQAVWWPPPTWGSISCGSGATPPMACGPSARSYCPAVADPGTCAGMSAGTCTWSQSSRARSSCSHPRRPARGGSSAARPWPRACSTMTRRPSLRHPATESSSMPACAARTPS